ncbi:hypothetical protein J3R30DRAFT_3718103 [Lentinula aciculospora]|uniref:Uncharacterized protein n=1 Tax=Lentinula aciculospora TaxID=153920 RepID=A0A9W9DF71_9AGAR|nr:hypothetical protein J3R30DRAFT_3718103 [Lentinula aciculospora]
MSKIFTLSSSPRLLRFISLLVAYTLLSGAFAAAFPFPLRSSTVERRIPRHVDVKICYLEFKSDGSQAWLTRARVRSELPRRTVEFICFITLQKCLGLEPNTETVLERQPPTDIMSTQTRCISWGYIIPEKFENWSPPKDLPNATLSDFLKNVERLRDEVSHNIENDQKKGKPYPPSYIATVEDYLVLQEAGKKFDTGEGSARLGNTKSDFGFGFYLFDDKGESRFAKIVKAGDQRLNAVCILPLNLCIAWNSDGVAKILRNQIKWQNQSSDLDRHCHCLLLQPGSRVTFKHNKLGDWATQNEDTITRLSGHVEASEHVQASEQVRASDLVFDVCLDKHPELKKEDETEKAFRQMMDCLLDEGLVEGYKPNAPLRKVRSSGSTDDNPNKKNRLSDHQPLSAATSPQSTKPAVGDGSSKPRTPLPFSIPE